MSGTRLVGALEIGGSHAAAALVDPTRRRLASTIERALLDPQASRADLLEAILGVAAALNERQRPVERWGVAVPGPFDYRRGISLITGVAKLEALYRLDLRAELAVALSADAQRFTFLNDADAFLLGEWWAGAAAGAARALGVTLGTGLGSAFLADGALTEHGPGVPAEGRLDRVPFEGAPVEDQLSARGLRRAYAEATAVRPGEAGVEEDDAPPPVNVAEIAARARSGDVPARAVMERFGGSLGRFLAPWLAGFAPDCLVLGGSIARAWDLFGPALLPVPGVIADGRRITVAQQLDAGPLLGAAYHAAG
ncbi:ROK family protein [soil metagenome]